jgi:type II secretory pathway component PulJ
MLKLRTASFTLRQTGTSLVELMVALAVSLVVVIGMITVTVTSLHSSSNNLEINRLDEQLRAAMDIMTSDIQRAGYWSNAATDVGLNTNSNPFMAAGTDISIPSSSCILFTYDHNKTGSLPAVNSGTDDDRYGYRLSGGAIQTRPVSASFSCTAGASTWENLTDPSVINITSLQFTTVPSTGYQTVNVGGHTVTIREIEISITGSLVSDATVSRTIKERVRVRNDKFT